MTGRQRRFLAVFLGAGIATTFLIAAAASSAAEGRRILVVGHGPEQPMIQDLARAFEKANPGSAIDIEWDRTLDTVEMVKAGQADLAIAGAEEDGFRSAQVAWDGVALIVHFANPLSDVSLSQAQSLFTGKLRRWSDLDGADKKVDVIRRTSDQNIQAGFERTLGITGKMVASEQTARADQKALATVSGRDNSLSYISLKSALQAQEQGAPIRILTVDQVEPGDPTVKNGRYKLRRPVLFLSKPTASPLVEAFTRFALSQDGQQILAKMYTGYEPPTSTPAQAKPAESDPTAPQPTG